MTSNIYYERNTAAIKHLFGILKEFNMAIAFFGSSIYGKSHNLGREQIKPDVESDIDCFMVCKDVSTISNLDGIIAIPSEGLEKFSNGYADVITLKSFHEEVGIDLKVMSERTYFGICDSSLPFFIEYKQAKNINKKPKSLYRYSLFGFKTKENSFSRIIPVQEGNLIIYPNLNRLSNGNFCLSIYQRQILTQKVYLDESRILDKGIKKLVDKTLIEAEKTYQSPISLFRDRSSRWSESFFWFMKERFKMNG